MKNNLDILEKYLQDNKVFEVEYPKIINALLDCITTNIPYRMKLAIIMSEISSFVSNFRINIEYWNKSIIPVNNILIILAKSGISKDSSVRNIKKCFKEGYNLIEHYKQEKLKEIAIKDAMNNGEEDYESYFIYKKYLKSNPVSEISISTLEGIVSNINSIDEIKIGSCFLYSGEIGSELSSNINITENIKLLSELYDEGSKEVKVLKDKTNQTKKIVNFPFNAILLGSHENILYDEYLKRKFKMEFSSKLARRSNFIFVKNIEEETEIKDINEFLNREKEKETLFLDNIIHINDYIKGLTENLINRKNKIITIEEDVKNLFIIYKEYNNEISKNISINNPLFKLTRQHLQWKALKLAGALSLLFDQETITLDLYRIAINFYELCINDIKEFEEELNKESYEVLYDFLKEETNDEEEHEMSIHHLKKMGFISKKNIKNELNELIISANSLDGQLLFKIKEKYDGIIYKKLYPKEFMNISYIICEGDKENRKKICNKGYKEELINFEQFENILNKDLAITPFKFIDGLRSSANVYGAIKWICLDVDDTYISDEECHEILENINHFIVRTSNKDNPYKYRIILELDYEIELTALEYKNMLMNIKDNFIFNIDILPKSQIFFVYSDRNILKVTDGIKLNIKNYIKEPTNIVTHKVTKLKDLSNINTIELFNSAYNAKDGEGSIKMISAIKKAIDLGFNEEQTIDLIYNINNYWVKQMDEERLQKTIISQIRKRFNNAM